MVSAKNQREQTETNREEDFQVMSDKQSAPFLANEPTPALHPIPWHLIFPPGHPMLAAGRT